MNFPQSCFRTSVSVLCSICKALCAAPVISASPQGGIFSGDLPGRLWVAQHSCFSSGEMWEGLCGQRRAQCAHWELLGEGPALLWGTEGPCCPQTSQHICSQPLPSCLPRRGTCWKSTQCQQAKSSSVFPFLDQWSSMISAGLVWKPLSRGV